MPDSNATSRQWRADWRVLLLALALLPGAQARCQSAAAAAVKWQPAKLVNGSPVLFQVTASSKVQSVSASWLGHDLAFFHPVDGKLWYALAGVPVETTPGRYDLLIRETLPSGKPVELRRSVAVGSANYPRITIQVAKQFTQPNPEQLREAAADKELKQKTFSVETQERLWAGEFVPPVSAPISDVFGTARVINEEVKSRHLGTDFGVPVGTPVHAVNGGKVLLARPLFFEGNCVVHRPRPGADEPVPSSVGIPGQRRRRGCAGATSRTQWWNWKGHRSPFAPCHPLAGSLRRSGYPFENAASLASRAPIQVRKPCSVFVTRFR